MLKLVKTESNKAGSEHVLEGIDGHGKSVYTDEAWAPSEVLYEPPLLKVTQPKGSFCTIDARFAVSLDPDGVYDIIIDPNNRHVFKNIKVWHILLCFFERFELLKSDAFQELISWIKNFLRKSSRSCV